MNRETLYKLIEEVLEEEGKKDACYHKVKANSKEWPSAYASGRLVQCREKGAANWGNSKKESLDEEVTDEEEDELKNIKGELNKASKMHKGQADRISDIVKEEKKNCGCGQDPCKTYGIQEKKQSSEDAGRLDKWFGRKGEKGSKGGWVDCNAPDGDGGYKECAQGDRKKKPYCRPTPSACKKEPQKNESKERSKKIKIKIKRNLDEKKKKPCKPSKGKRFAKRVDGKCRSFGQKGQAKGGGDRIRPGTKKGDAYCARSAGIKKCKEPPCANDLSRKKWKCRGDKSMK